MNGREFMFSACANPDCKINFDHREGRFFRFRKEHLAGDELPNTHCVQHLWLCGRCAEKFTLAYEEARGVVMTSHCMDLREEQDACRFVAVA